MATTPHLQPGTLIRIRGERWRVRGRPDVLDGAVVDVSGCDRSNTGTRAAFVIAAEHILPLPERRTPRFVRPARWRRIARRALAEAVPGTPALAAAAGARVSILPFQLEPALALAHGLGCRLLVADAVGLGKTVQAGLIVAELLYRRDDARVLIVTPASLREQWRDELHERFDLRVTTLDAAEVARSGAEGAGTNPWAMRRLIVTSIDYVKRPEVLGALEGLVWDALILDEAHALCGLSDRAAAAARLATRARVVVSLTATPHSGDETAFARLCGVGRIDRAPLLVFRRSRSDVGLASARRTSWLGVRLSYAERCLHAALMQYARLVWRQPPERRSAAHLALIVLVRRACSSPASLLRSLERRRRLLESAPAAPELQTSLPFGTDEEPDAILGAAALDDPALEGTVLAELVELARAACADERKVAVLRRLLHRTPEPIIIFTEYRDTLEHIEASLWPSPSANAKAAVRRPPEARCVVVHGGLTANERRDALRRFTTGDARVLLATDAASEGLNLHQRCRCVVHMELPWSPVRLEQRTGRVDRIGQTKRVHALHLVASGTEEETTVARLLRRMTRARAALVTTGRQDDEAAIAAHIMRTGTPAAPPGDAPRELVDDLVFPDLRAAAVVEARRLLRSRELARSTSPVNDPRAVVTRVRHVRRRRRVWAFRVTLAGSDEQPICTMVMGLEAPPVILPTGSDTPDDLLQVEEIARLVHDTIAAESVPVREALHSIQRSVRLAIDRERAIVARITASRARLAPRQGSLFDRRAERTADAQAAVLDEAVHRCEARLVRLASDAHPVVQSCEVAFAVLLG